MNNNFNGDWSDRPVAPTLKNQSVVETENIEAQLTSENPEVISEDSIADITIANTSIEDVIADTKLDSVEAGTDPEDDPEFEDDDEGNQLTFPRNIIDFRGTSQDLLVSLMKKAEDVIGATLIDQRVREPGTWENLIMRALVPNQISFEELRIREFLERMSPEEKELLLPKLIDHETGKVLLRTSPINGRPVPAGETKVLTGSDAMLAFESFSSGNSANKNGGAFRVILANSGITLDILVPTGVDVQTMLMNCVERDRALGASYGAHYFTFADQLYKSEIIKFIEPLIINSNYNDWRKNGKLWSVIKLPDLNAILMTIAASCFRNGFENFKATCTNLMPNDPKQICGHVESITANLFDMIVTRYAVIPSSCIEFLAKARSLPKHKNNISEIAQYQQDLGIEGRQVTIGNLRFSMKIPTIMEHLNAGAEFLADIENEISGDNTGGRLSSVGIRYMRTFLPWIASMEGINNDEGSILTTEPKVILRMLEHLDREDNKIDIREELLKYIDESQLTYVGWPAVECSKCHQTTDTPSGMVTFDPFTAFFTVALLYSKIDQ